MGAVGGWMCQAPLSPGFSSMETASMAAASGRHRNAASAALRARLRLSAVLALRLGQGDQLDIPPGRTAASRMRSPWVPALPSIKIRFI